MSEASVMSAQRLALLQSAEGQPANGGGEIGVRP